MEQRKIDKDSLWSESALKGGHLFPVVLGRHSDTGGTAMTSLQFLLQNSNYPRAITIGEDRRAL